MQGSKSDAPEWCRDSGYRGTVGVHCARTGLGGGRLGNRWLYPECSGREGLNLTGASPVVPIARFRHVAIPQFVMGNHTFFAWCQRSGCPEDGELLR
jgi:hypothetical protein